MPQNQRHHQCIISALTRDRRRVTVRLVEERSFGISGSRIHDLSVQ